MDVALVCGSSGALGRSLVEAFLARGDRVVAVHRTDGGGDSASPVLRREAVDLSIPARV
jgi:NAD(P)-dependent dehydrogenase (short-subunit alcohol dehydrogenase family)